MFKKLRCSYCIFIFFSAMFIGKKTDLYGAECCFVSNDFQNGRHSAELAMALPPFHAFKMSVCEIIYKPQSHNFEVKCYLFQDDLRETLYNDPKNGLLSPEIVVPYIQKHLAISVNQQQQPLQYTSLQTKEEQILVQFSMAAAPNTSKISNISVQNNLLLEKFSKQVNVVYVYYPTEQNKHTKMLNLQKTQDIFEF